MPVVSIFSGSFCRGEETVEALREATGYLLVKDDDIVTRAAELSGIPGERLSRCLSARLSAFNPFTRELERSIAWLKLATGEYLQENNFILHGFTAHLIPPVISHALHVCLIADLPYRIHDCMHICDITRDDAGKRIALEDSRKTAWVDLLKGSKDPWDPSCYDMVLPTSLLGVEKTVRLIQRGINANAVMPTDASMDAAVIFLKDAQIAAALADKGHAAHVKTNGSHVTLIIDRPVMMLQRLEEELRDIVTALPGIDKVEIRVDPKPGKNEIYRKFSIETPSRVLLVDDEREFIQTLSERLGMREIGSAVAYDGESALEMLANDEPDVMLLDLQMPGINGIEVLKRVKETRPEIEVIILTGHGTQKDRDLCMQIGAFAYLEKPVDIEVLSKTLSLANDKMRQNQTKDRR
jgi:two-component system, OmpR family, response regulator CpxR